jgi:two-component system, sensor histidine kinase and response regulator
MVGYSMAHKGTAFIIDDRQENIEMLSRMLTMHGYNCESCMDGKQVWQRLQEANPIVILTDLLMPMLDGYELCKMIKSDEKLYDVPIIFLSARNEPKAVVKAFEMGAVDYIPRPFNLVEVLARVNTHVKVYQQKQQIALMHEAESHQLRGMNQLKDDVLRIASHDLKNPLSVIIGNALILQDSLSKRGVLFDDEKQQFDQIRRSSENMMELIRDLLDVVRVEGQVHIEHEMVSLNTFLQNCYDEFVLLADTREIRFDFIPIVPDIQVFIAPSRFRQVIQNLLSNAIKYTDGGESVSLVAGIVDDEVVIHVIDTGIGIPASALPHLFTKFYRADNVHGRSESGAGLGLAIVKSVVEQHKGEISVQSEEGKGSHFTVKLPRL